jgi:four helix bundle protein
VKLAKQTNSQPSHKALLAWRKARELVISVYQLTSAFPESERYVMTPQMRRAAVSVISNIAEGAARGSDRELVRFLLMARGSLSELDSQLVVAVDLGFTTNQGAAEEQIALLGRLISGLIAQVRRKRRSVSG